MDNRPMYSAEITEIIGTPPRWIMRAGGGLLLLVLVVVVGLASVISLPEQNVSPLLIKGVTQPYYLLQTKRGLRPAVASGQLVEPGQRLAGNPLDTAQAVRAPFRGTLFYDDAAGPAARPGDTLAMLVPQTNTYRFSGKVEMGRVAELRKCGALQIQVPLDSRLSSSLALQGRLSYINPVVRNGQVLYTGQLDSLSNVRLGREVATITDLKGTLLVSSTRKPVLQRLFN